MTQIKKPIKVADYTKKRKEEVVLDNPPRKITTNLHTNLSLLKKLFHNSSDIIIRKFTLDASEIEVGLVYLDCLTDKHVINQDIMQQLMYRTYSRYKLTKNNAFEYVKEYLLTIGEIEFSSEVETILDSILSGNTALFIDGSEQAILTSTKGWAMRSPTEPTVEAVVRGPREGFTETLMVNLGLIRRRLKDPDLIVKMLNIGRRTKTSVAVLYVSDLANPKIISELCQRLNSIDIDGILESGYIEQLIQDSTATPFPQIHSTERPDKIVANLLEGRAAIIVDGTPIALIVPSVWTQFFHSPEDYYERFQIASFIRLIRLLSMSFSLILPSIYIAFSSFHPEMLPTTLALAISAARAGVPFSPFLETLLMEIMVEIVREASVRLPGPIGPTIGIVGGLVIGEAAVRAGIVSPLTVVIIAITAISSFTSPSYSSAIALRLLRFPFMILAATFGFYGIAIGIILLGIHLTSLESFGVPYLAPYTPFYLEGQRDAIIRFPWNLLLRRPPELDVQDEWRQPQPEKNRSRKQ